VGCRLAVAPQSGAKDLFCFTVYYIAFNPIFVAQRLSKNWKKMCKIGLEASINTLVF